MGALVSAAFLLLMDASVVARVVAYHCKADELSTGLNMIASHQGLLVDCDGSTFARRPL